jgi:tetratricopeptide (TPR) repeat protein
MRHVGPAALGLGVGLIWVTWTGGALPIYTPLLTAVGAWAITQAVMRIAVGVAAAYADPRGTTTPHRAEYSHAQALAAQGRYAEAVAAYEVAAAESAGDPVPYVEVARIQRDHLADYESAAIWFRRARRDARLSPGQELLIAQELIELYTKRLHQPRRAIPELARIRQLVPGTPRAAAAEQEIAEIRAAPDVDGPESGAPG